MRKFFLAVALGCAACELAVDWDHLDDGNATPDGGSPAPVGDAAPASDASIDATSTDAAPVDAGPDENYRLAILADHPDGYWRLDEAPGASVAKDQVGTHDGTYSNVTTAPGPFTGKLAAVFNGNNSVVALPDSFDYSGTAEYTIEAWAEPEFTRSTGCHHIFNREVRQSPRQGYGLLEYQDAGLMLERIVADGIQNTIYGTQTFGMVTDTFAHVVATFQASGPQVYVNGTLVGTGIPDSRQLDPKSITPVIGAAAVNDCVWNGRIAELAIYSKALPATRIAAHYAARF